MGSHSQISDSNLIWIDLEMTGLDPEKHVIIEIATVITDEHLNVVDEGPVFAINYPDHILSSIDEWSSRHHNISGLMDRVKGSTYDCRTAENETLNFVSRYCMEGSCPLCGNSVWQDRRFLIKHMPRLEAFFHYRNIDVSSIKEISRRWYPDLPPFTKQKNHLALSDIKESIDEMKYYRENVFTSRKTPFS